jgi:hypothetical protein
MSRARLADGAAVAVVVLVLTLVVALDAERAEARYGASQGSAHGALGFGGGIFGPAQGAH